RAILKSRRRGITRRRAGKTAAWRGVIARRRKMRRRSERPRRPPRIRLGRLKQSKTHGHYDDKQVNPFHSMRPPAPDEFYQLWCALGRKIASLLSGHPAFGPRAALEACYFTDKSSKHSNALRDHC